MRIRSTKPEFWHSERIYAVSWEARLVLKGLESYVDDNGVGKDDLSLIAANVFPRDLSGSPTGTLQRITGALQQLSEAGLVWRYEDENTKLLYISFWESVQRIEKPAKGRFRRPDGTMQYRESYIRQPLPEPSRNTPGTLQPGTGEQGNRGTGEQGNRGTGEGSSLTLVEGGPGGDPMFLEAPRKRSASQTRGTRLPLDWTPDPEVWSQMQTEYPNLDLEFETKNFKDYWIAIPGQRGIKLDWKATWRKWIRTAAERHPKTNGHTIQGADLRAIENQKYKTNPLFQELE